MVEVRMVSINSKLHWKRPLTDAKMRGIVVIEVVGHSSALRMGFEMLRPWGVMSSVGVHNGE